MGRSTSCVTYTQIISYLQLFILLIFAHIYLTHLIIHSLKLSEKLIKDKKVYSKITKLKDKFVGNFFSTYASKKQILGGESFNTLDNLHFFLFSTNIFFCAKTVKNVPVLLPHTHLNRYCTGRNWALELIFVSSFNKLNKITFISRLHC